uniref:NPA domain-containing protein n=1 Tax=Steinernema glaseri TaxID=37863 RepID=A0A1I8A9B3_9BILA
MKGAVYLLLALVVLSTAFASPSISDQIDKTLSWLSPEQKEEIRKMHEERRPQSEIKANYLERLPKARQDKIRKYLDVCERLWYGSHHGQQKGAHAKHQNHHGHHHERKRRHGERRQH